MTSDKLKDLIAQVVKQVVEETNSSSVLPKSQGDGGYVDDLSAIDFKTRIAIPCPSNAAEMLRIKAKSPARIGVWRAGPRYRTETFLRFRADHAVAMDAVFTDVPEDLLESMGLLAVSTVCSSKDEFLTRPDLGREFSPETLALVKSKCKNNPKVQIIIADGLSSTAVSANVRDILPSIIQGLDSFHIDCGTPFFVKYGRVGAMDRITTALNADVTVILLGERPGLATGDSLSAYMTYKGYVGMPEAGRTVVSNIYSGGTPPVEAGAHIAHIINEMLTQKASGLDLKL